MEQDGLAEPVVGVPAVHIYLDESGTHAGSDRILVGAVATLQDDELGKSIKELQQTVLASAHHWQGSPGKRARFEAVGYHYTEDVPSVQDSFVSLIPQLAFRAHVIHSQRLLGVSDSSIQTIGLYLLALNTMRRYRVFPITYTFEQDSAKGDLYGRILGRAIAVSGHRSVAGRIASKPNAGISLVDYVLGIAADRLNQREKFRRFRYDSLIPHVAHLLDLDTALHASRGRATLFV